MQAQVRPAADVSEYYFHEGCFITEYSNSDNDPECSIAKARVEPGKTTRWHSLNNTTERYVIVRGSARVDVDELSQQVSAGDVVIIPPQCPQRITNTGNEDVEFLAICTPRFDADNYCDLEKQR